MSSIWLEARKHIQRRLETGYCDEMASTLDEAERLSRVLTNDPRTGVMRHVDAGYEEAMECAREQGVKIPML